MDTDRIELKSSTFDNLKRMQYMVTFSDTLGIFTLGGHAKTLMFAHVSPEGDSFGETVSTLKFAQRVSTVELGTARANKESNEVMQLKEQVNTSI